MLLLQIYFLGKCYLYTLKGISNAKITAVSRQLGERFPILNKYICWMSRIDEEFLVAWPVARPTNDLFSTCSRLPTESIETAFRMPVVLTKFGFVLSKRLAIQTEHKSVNDKCHLAGWDFNFLLYALFEFLISMDYF